MRKTAIKYGRVEEGWCGQQEYVIYQSKIMAGCQNCTVHGQLHYNGPEN